MKCREIARQLEFDCIPLKGCRGEEVFELGTPFSFEDGTAICVYVVDRGQLAEICDDALAFHHLASIGLDPWGGRRLALLRERVQPYGVTIRDNGALSLLAAWDRLSWHIPRFISASLAIASWAREQVATTETARNLAEEVEMYLRAWRPGTLLTRSPKLRGMSGYEHRFDFEQGGELIDVISPHPNATGGLMRKLGDVLNAAVDVPPKVRVIVDDRTDSARADVEMRIIASLAAAMPLTKLISCAPTGNA